MKVSKIIVIAGVGLLTVLNLNGFTCGNSTFVARGQNADSVRRFENKKMQEVDEYSCYSFRVAAQYLRSFRSCKIASHFFGADNLTFSGSRVTDRGEKNIFADYFGLPSDFVSKVSFKPIIQDFVIDGGVRLNMDWIRDGVYLQFWLPLVHTRWDMRMCEKVSAPGQNFSPAGYLSGGNIRIERDRLPKDVATVFKGGTTFGDMQDPLRYGKIGCVQKRTNIANLKAQLGWDFANKDDYQIGGSLIIVAPAGNKRTAEYLFEPIIGNDNHWELGLGLNGRWDFWHSDDETQIVSFFGQAELTHMFASWQKRSFDFKNNRGSRYMLISTLDALHDDILEIPEGTAPALQYTGHLFHAINKTTLDSKIKVGIQADILLGFTYINDAWSFDLGYNFWARSKESLSCRDKFQDGKFAAKGDAQLYGFFAVQDAEQNDRLLPLAVNATQSQATIYGGQGVKNLDVTNTNADNSVDAHELINAAALENGDGGELKGSNLPILLADSDIDCASALQSRLISNTFFVRSFYTWEDKEDWTPHLGLGLKVEVGNKFSAVSRFGIWLEAGFSC